MSTSEQEARVRLRAEVILKVRAGVMTAMEAAEQLGVSRKTYYKWEKRALAAMMEGLYERNSGRPASEVDEEKQNLQKKVQALERELEGRRQMDSLRDLLRSEAKKKG